MIRLRDAAASLLDEPMRQIWLNLEWDVMLSLTTERMEVTAEERGLLADIRGWLLCEVLHLLRTGEWVCEGFQRGDVIPTTLSVSWWLRQNDLALWDEITRWGGQELTRLAIVVLAQEPPGAAPDNAPPPKKRPRNMSEGSARCIRVAGGVLYSEGKPEKGGGTTLAKHALDRAAELGHPWSDALSPDTMREVAEALLLGIKDEDDAPGTKPQ